MAKPKISLTTKSAAAKTLKAPKAGGKAAGPMQDFLLVDNEDSSYTVQGVDAAGATVDISTVATLAATSSDPSVLTVDPPVGMTGAVHGVKPGSVTVTLTATWNDPTAGIGPFNIEWPLTVSAGPATGIVVTPGTPTVRP